MANIFKDVQMANVPSNRFNMTHDVKTSFRMGELVPISVNEVMPGDSWNLKHEMMLRLAPLVSPVMHMIDAHIHTFFVPYRILWPEWEDWITGESTATHPTINRTATSANFEPGGLAHFLGYRNVASGDNFQSAFPLAAYLKIYNEYYRDQNLQAALEDELVAGDNFAAMTAAGTILSGRPFKRAWEHDYFTSALPFAQKGDPVQLPLLSTTSTDVTLKVGSTTPTKLVRADTQASLGSGALLVGADSLLEGGGANIDAQFNPQGNLEVDINSEAVDISTLRRAFRMQEFLEKDARGGTRYIENILAHFGVRGRDRRLQRPHYIGGEKARVQISEVLSTAQSSDDAATAEQVVGQMAGHGISIGGGNRSNFTADEHGLIMTIMSVRPKTAYHQGLHRMFSRNDRFDYPWPSFAHIGEQPVLNQEVYANDTAVNRGTTFGYVPRYAEFKYKDSTCSGLMASDLEYWHLARKFSGTPALNSDFIECDPDTRIFADTTGDHIIGHILNDYSVRRKLPVFGNPTI